MDPLWVWLALLLAATATAVVAFVRFRKRQMERARAGLSQVQATLLAVEDGLRSFTAEDAYITEQVRRPLHAKPAELLERDLPAIAKVVRRARDPTMRESLERAHRQADELRKQLDEHNGRFVERRVAEHAKLL